MSDKYSSLKVKIIKNKNGVLSSKNQALYELNYVLLAKVFRIFTDVMRKSHEQRLINKEHIRSKK